MGLLTSKGPCLNRVDVIAASKSYGEAPHPTSSRYREHRKIAMQRLAIAHALYSNIDFRRRMLSPYHRYRVGRCVNTFYISPFDGEKEIRSLKYYPTRFFSESKEINDKNGGKTFDQRLVTRGKKFWALAKMGNCYQEYNGETAERPYKKVSHDGMYDHYQS